MPKNHEKCSKILPPETPGPRHSGLKTRGGTLINCNHETLHLGAPQDFRAILRWANMANFRICIEK